MLRIEIEHL